MKDIVAIEIIQRRAIKIVPTLWYLPYKELLQRLYITTSEARRRRSDIHQAYNIFNGIGEIDNMYFYEQSADSHSYFIRGHTFEIAKQPCNVNVRKYSFFQLHMCD